LQSLTGLSYHTHLQADERWTKEATFSWWRHHSRCEKVCCLCWCTLLRAQHAGCCSSLTKMHSQWWWLCGTIVFCSWQLAQSNGVIVYPVSYFSVEINRRHYFQSPPCSKIHLSHSNMLKHSE
jgi:hypothetical protein